MSGDNPFGYSARVWRLFIETPRSGLLEGAGVLTGAAETHANRNRLQFQVRVEEEHVTDARFQAYGCPTTIAVGAWLAGEVIGKTLPELAAFKAKDIRQTLEIPEDRLHCVLMAEDAIKSLLATR
jgi:NifU-like protein involved in Fe-S cluster formation